MSLDIETSLQDAQSSKYFEAAPKRLVAYVAGPYRDDRGEWFVWQNIARARQVSAELWKMGFAAICPHLNTAFFGGACGDGAKREPWIEGDLEILRRCDLVVMLDGWDKSEGARVERHTAYSHRIPVYYWPLNENRLQLIASGDGSVSRRYHGDTQSAFISCTVENNAGSGFLATNS